MPHELKSKNAKAHIYKKKKKKKEKKKEKKRRRSQSTHFGQRTRFLMVESFFTKAALTKTFTPTTEPHTQIIYIYTHRQRVLHKVLEKFMHRNYFQLKKKKKFLNCALPRPREKVQFNFLKKKKIERSTSQ
jgi:hypothetical protein